MFSEFFLKAAWLVDLPCSARYWLKPSDFWLFMPVYVGRLYWPLVLASPLPTCKTLQITTYPHLSSILSPAPKAKTKLSMMHSKFICCKLYISESRNAMAVDAIDRASRRDPQVVVLSKFEDCHYNRVRYTLVSYIINDRSTGEIIYSPIRQALLAMIEAAFSNINLELHSGAHPRIGVIDDISFHPLGQATMEEASQLAKLVASDIGNGLQGMLNLLSVYKYQPYNSSDPPLPFFVQSRCSFMQQPTPQASLLVQYGVSSATTGQIIWATSGQVRYSQMSCQLGLMRVRLMFVLKEVPQQLALHLCLRTIMCRYSVRMSQP